MIIVIVIVVVVVVAASTYIQILSDSMVLGMEQLGYNDAV